MNTQTKTKPPAIAQGAISLFAMPEYRDDILGDLHEEFTQRADLSVSTAQRWYWAEVFYSVPSLVVRRMQHIGTVRIGVLVVACLAALVAIDIWDIHVARRTAYLLASSPDAPSLFVTRAAYFLMFAIGTSIAGAVSAVIGFRKDKTFRANVSVTLLPVFLILTSMIIVSLAIKGTENWLSYFLIRSGLMIPSLLFGGAIVRKLQDQ